MSISIRRAAPPDLDPLVPLFDGYRQFYGKSSDPALARRFLGDRLTEKDSIVLIAARGRGAGSLLLESAAAVARASGAVRLKLSTAVTNLSAQRRYEAMGWKRDEDFYEYGLSL